MAVELHQANEDSSDIYFSMENLYQGGENDLNVSALQNDTICLGVGADSSEMLVTWRGTVCSDPYVQVVSIDSEAFSDKSATYHANSVYMDNEKGECTYRCILDKLTPGYYLYKTVDKTESDEFRFNIADKNDSFSFLCSGDPQVIDDNDLSIINIYRSLADSIMGAETPQLILSLGDQSNDSSDPDLFRFFTRTPIFKSVPLAAIVGNHEKNSDLFSQYFYMPNMDRSTMGNSGDMSGDYWFFRNNTLFLCLNSNNGDPNAHKKFMTEAKNTCETVFGKPVWTVAALHYSFFSAGGHVKDDDIVNFREAYAEAFKEVGVDAVFSGHDHIYTRSYPMNGSVALKKGEEGTVYFTLGSSTGSKQYDIEDNFDYVAFADDSKYPAMTRVDVTDKTMTVITYLNKNGNIETLESYTINKKVN